MSYIMFTFFMVILHFLDIYIVVDNVDNFVDNLFSKLSFQSYPHILLLINLWKRIFFAVQFIMYIF